MKARYFLFTLSFIVISAAQAAIIQTEADKVNDYKQEFFGANHNIKGANTNLMMALDEDVIFNQSESSVLLGEYTTTVPDINGKNIEFDVFCQLERQENSLKKNENHCADYPKSKIKKDTFYHIKNTNREREYPAFELIQFETSIEKNQCRYTLRFECGTGPLRWERGDFSYYRDIPPSIRTILSGEVKTLASKFIKIQDDPIAPTPWP